MSHFGGTKALLTNTGYATLAPATIIRDISIDLYNILKASKNDVNKVRKQGSTGMDANREWLNEKLSGSTGFSRRVKSARYGTGKLFADTKTFGGTLARTVKYTTLKPVARTFINIPADVMRNAGERLSRVLSFKDPSTIKSYTTKYDEISDTSRGAKLVGSAKNTSTSSSSGSTSSSTPSSTTAPSTGSSTTSSTPSTTTATAPNPAIMAQITQLQNDMRKLQADLTQTKADLTQTQADLTQAKTDLTQTQADLTQAKTDLNTANERAKKAEIEKDWFKKMIRSQKDATNIPATHPFHHLGKFASIMKAPYSDFITTNVNNVTLMRKIQDTKFIYEADRIPEISIITTSIIDILTDASCTTDIANADIKNFLKNPLDDTKHNVNPTSDKVKLFLEEMKIFHTNIKATRMRIQGSTTFPGPFTTDYFTEFTTALCP